MARDSRSYLRVMAIVATIVVTHLLYLRYNSSHSPAPSSIAPTDTPKSLNFAAKPMSDAPHVLPSGEAGQPAHGNPPSPGPSELATRAPAVADEGDPLVASISGSVLDDGGQLVVGMLVTALLKKPFRGSDDGFIQDPVEYETRSQADGYFVFDGLAEGIYELRTRETADFLTTLRTARSGASAADLIVTRRREILVRGRIEDENGKSLAGVRVAPLGQRGQATHSDEMGTYALYADMLPGGRVPVLEFELRGYRKRQQRLPTATLAANDAVRLDARLTSLTDVSPVSGVVTTADGMALKGVDITLSSVTTQGSHTVTTQGDGSFLIPAVESAEDYRFSAHARDTYRDRTETGLIVNQDGLQLDIVLEPLDVTRLSGYLSDPLGNPLAGFSLWLRGLTTMARRGQLITSNDDGFFSVANAPTGPVRLETQSQPLLSVSGIELTPGRQNEVRAVLDWGNESLFGRVVDPYNVPVGGARVSLRWSHSIGGMHSRSRRATLSDADGLFVFHNLSAGPHGVSVSAPGYSIVHLDHQVATFDEELLVRLE